MVEKHVSKFLEEVQKHQNKDLPIDPEGLRAAITRILEAFIFKNLQLQNSKTYSLDFTENFVAIELGSLHQTRCALAALVDLINEGEYLTLPYSKEPRSTLYYARTERDIRESFEVFDELFHKYPGQRDAIIKDLNRYAHFLSQEGLVESLEQFEGVLEKEIKYLENILEDVSTWNDFPLYYGDDAEVMKSRVRSLLASKIARQEVIGVRNEIEKALLRAEQQKKSGVDQVNPRPDIFTSNGFELFDYLMKNHLSSGIGRQSDVAFFYRMMNEREKPPLVHAKQTPFKLFVYKEYSGFEPDWKFKSWYDINTEKRRQAYSSAKDAIGLK